MPLEFPWKLEYPAEQVQQAWQWLLVTGLGFVLIVWFVRKYVAPMIGTILADRHRAIVETTDQVRETLRETEAMRNEYRDRLEQIEDEAERRMTEAVGEAEALREHILADGKLAADVIVRRGEDEVAHERAQAVVRLRRDFVDDVVRAAEYAASRTLADTRQRRLVDEFVQKVGERP